MNMIRAGGAVPSAGSGEALCVLEAAGLAEHLSALRLSGGSQHLHLGLVWCAAPGTVDLSLEACSPSQWGIILLLYCLCLGCLRDRWKVQ